VIIIENEITPDIMILAAEINLEIEANKSASDLNYIESVVKYCEDHDFDAEKIGEVLNQRILAEIEMEAEALHLITPFGSRLPE